MKTERGKFGYDIPEDCYKIASATVIVGDIMHELRPIFMAELAKAIKQNITRHGSPVWGLPVYFAADEEIFCLYPAPDEEYEVTVRYFPAIKVW